MKFPRAFHKPSVNLPRTFHRCDDASVNCTVNPDGSFGAAGCASGCRGGIWDPNSSLAYRNAQCAPNLVGPFCQECEEAAEGESRTF